MAVEVGEEELGACLGAVEADDAEVFGSDLLDAGMEHAAGLADGWQRVGVRTGGGYGCVAMRGASKKRDMAHLIFAADSSGSGSFYDKTHIPGDIADCSTRTISYVPLSPPYLPYLRRQMHVRFFVLTRSVPTSNSGQC